MFSNPVRFFAVLFFLTLPLGADAKPCCKNWSESDFWKQAGSSDVTFCLSAGADPEARTEGGLLPADLAEDSE